MSNRAKLEKYIEDLGIEYSAVFVPFSQSRNKDEKHKTLNWKVTVKRGGAELTTDYMQGEAHAPCYKSKPEFSNGKTDEHRYRQALAIELESGKKASYLTDSAHMTRVEINPPPLRDVLYALTMDASVLNFASYEEWASEYGYGEDSRKGNKIYQDCLKIALKLKQIIPDLEGLSNQFQDY